MITIQINEFIRLNNSDDALWSMKITDSHGTRERVMTLNALVESLSHCMDVSTKTNRLNVMEGV